MEKRLKLMLLMALLGIFILILISKAVQPKTLDIAEITNSLLGEDVSVIAKITKIQEYNNDTFQVLTLKDSSGSIAAIANSKTGLKNRINITQNRSYLIKGEVQEYNSSLQINIDKIILKN